MHAFTVKKPGPLTTLQDLGRRRHSHLGLSEGGPMDYRSHLLANRLLENQDNDATLEITFGGVSLQCHIHTNICLTGAFAPFSINGKPVKLWCSHAVKPGDHIEIGFAALGVRAYLGVQGGFLSTPWFESRATVVRETVLKPLQTQQQLNAIPHKLRLNHELSYLDQPQLRNKAQLDFVPGYQWHLLANSAQESFLTSTFFVTAKNDRMGYPLEGPALDTGISDMASEGISLGAIQITGDGQPIVLMRDRQTIGGYPKVGAVTLASLDALAQLKPGSEVTFSSISAEQAIQRRRQYQLNIPDFN